MAIGAGFVDGLGYGGNTKAAIIRIGLKEMVCAATLARPASTFPRAADHRAPIAPPRQKKFCNMFYDGIDDDTFLESCGVADLITTCFGGRNRKCADIFAKCICDGAKKEWDVIEAEELNGQKLQGTGTAKDVMTCLNAKECAKDFPLFCAIYKIAFEGAAPKSIIEIN